MIEFKSVKLQNFKSFGNKETDIKLDDTGATLILGNNEDIGEKGNSRNGTGKSSALSSVVFALYGKDLDKLKPDELVNLRNGKKMRVELSFSVKGKDFTVIRGRKPNILELYQGDKSLTRDSMKNTEQEILDIIGIDYDVFLSIFFLNPFKETFMAMTPASQRNFMEKVLSLDILAERAEALKAIKKDLSVDVKLAIKDRDNAVMMREREEEQLRMLKEKADSFERKRQEAIEDHTLAKEEYAKLNFGELIKEAEQVSQPNTLEEKIRSLEEQQKHLNREKQAIIKQIDMVNKQIESSQKWETDRQSQINELERRIDEMPSLDSIERRDELRQQILAKENAVLGIHDKMRKLAEIEIPSLKREQDALEKEFSALEGGVCPYCEQKHTDDDRMEEIAAEFEGISDRVDKLLVSLHEMEEKALKEMDELDVLKASVPDIGENVAISDVRRLEDRLASLQEQENPHREIVITGEEERQLIDDIDASVSSIGADIESLIKENAAYDARQKEYKDDLYGKVGTWDVEEIKEMKRDFESIDKLIKEEEGKENPYQTQVEEFTALTDIDVYDEAVTTLEEKEKHCSYLVKLLTDPKSFIRKNIVDQYVPYLNKKINEYTQYLDLPHVSEINSDMTVDIEYMGKTVSYFTLSRGERLRVDIATAMAFRDLLKMMGTGMNLLLVDEVLDSALDPHGTHKTFEFIKQFATNTLLVSHREEFQMMVDRVMIVNKRNGFSVID